MNSMADDLDREPLAVSVLEDKKDALYRMAEDYLVSRLGKEKDYERVVYSYRDKDGLLDHFNPIFFYSSKADGSAYEMRMNVEREAFSDFQMIDNYEEYVENLNKIGESNAAQNRKGKLVYKDMEL